MSDEQKDPGVTDAISLDAEIALVMMDIESMSDDRLALEKISAILSLYAIANTYRKEGFREDIIIHPIIRKKIAFIKTATSKSELKEILGPPKVRYDGNKIRPVGSYTIPEEELIFWSRTSLLAPIITPADDRYREVFKEIFPDISKEIGV